MAIFRIFTAFFLFFGLLNPLCAQENAENAAPPDVLALDEANFAQMAPRLLKLPVPRLVWNQVVQKWQRAANDADGVELNLSRAALSAAPDLVNHLRAWANAGGILVFHTDAAQLFGFTTKEARLAKREQGGQLFGYAETSMPLGALNLLDGATQKSPWGVREVWYQLAAGDHLALRHPQGVPLLRVQDLADLAPPATPLYAALLAPQGKGWLMFGPRRIETHRGDGALYAQNLQFFLGGAKPLQENALMPCALLPSLAGQLAAIAPPLPASPTASQTGATLSSAISPAINAAPEINADADDVATLQGKAQPLEIQIDAVLEGQIFLADADTKAPPGTPLSGTPLSGTALLVPRGEVLAMRAALHELATRPIGISPDAKIKPLTASAARHLRDAISVQGLLWQTQRAWQSNSLENAELILTDARKRVPQTFEVTWWHGLLAAQAGLDIERAAPDAASWLEKAAAYWKEAATQPPLWKVLSEAQ